MTAPAIVLLPGLDGTATLFWIREQLRARGSVIAVAYPNDRVVPRSELHATIERAIPPHGDYVLVAESFSGALAIEHAANSAASKQKASRLLGVVLVASFAANPLPFGLRWLRTLTPLMRWSPRRMPAPLVRLLLVGASAPPEAVRAVQAAIASVPGSVVADRLRQVCTIDVREQLAALTVPVLYLAGRRDRLVGQRGLAQCAQGARHFHSEQLDGPHLLLQVCTEPCAAAISRFIDGRVAAPKPVGRDKRGPTDP